MAQQQKRQTNKKGRGIFDVIPVLAAAVFVVVMVIHLVGSSEIHQAVAELGLPIGSAMTAVASWSGWRPLMIITLGVLAAAVIGRVIVGWGHRKRDDQRARLAATLQRHMPEEWDPKTHLRVRRWRRFVYPRKVRITLTPATPDTTVEWRTSMTTALRERMGTLRPISWPPPEKEHKRLLSRRIVVVADPSGKGAQATDESDTKTTEILTGALNGLVPKPEPQVTITPEGKRIITIKYGETTRDQSVVWRARVVDQVQARLGDDRLRDSWDRKDRKVTLAGVPQLPKMLQWAEQQAKLREEAPAFTRWAVPYGTDEDDRIVYWEPGDEEPHGLVVGETGSGKTETMKTIAAGWLILGGLLMIGDWKKGWSEFLGKPGVIVVATEDEDRVGMLEDIRTEVNRRIAAKDLKEIAAGNPDLQVDLPEQSFLDEIPILFIIDELTLHQKGVQSWWSSLSKEEKKDEYGTAATNAPMLTWPAELVMVTRAIKMFGLFGMQRPDAANFGDSTAMRENLAHMISMGRLKRIGSEMMWTDGQIGVNVEIGGRGEGLSNGYRLGSDRRSTVPGRFKAWYLDGALQTSEFWMKVAENQVASPDQVIRMKHVSDAAVDPKAAVQALWDRAYGSLTGLPAPKGRTTEAPGGNADLAPAGAGSDDTAGSSPAGLQHQPWAQSTYGCGRDGWGTLQNQGLSEKELAAITSQVSTFLDGEAKDLTRLAYGPVDPYDAPTGAMAWWHSNPAGSDWSGRPGNVFTHVLVSRHPSGALPVDVAQADGWLAPVGPEAIDAAKLGDVPPTPARPDLKRAVDFITAEPGRTGRLIALVDACIAALRGGHLVGLALDDLSQGLQWIDAVSRFLPAAEVHRFSWSSLEQPVLSQAAAQPRFHLVCMTTAHAAKVSDRTWTSTTGPIPVGEPQTAEARSVLGVFSDPDTAVEKLSLTTPVPVRSRSKRQGPPPVELPAEITVTPADIVRDVVDQPDDVEVDDTGAAWEEIPVSEVNPGQTVQFSDMPGGKVVDVPGWTQDEFDGADVFRVVIETSTGEQVLDLSGEEVVSRQAELQPA